MNVVMCTQIMQGLISSGKYTDLEIAVDVLHFMDMHNIAPNPRTYSVLLSGCASSSSIDIGETVFNHLIKSGCEQNSFIQTSLLNMFAKGGELEKAKEVFNSMRSTRKSQMTTVEWTAMIAAYGQHGQGNEALALFEQMLRENINPNNQTIGCILNACSHAGLVKEAMQIFSSMKARFGISPDVMHYNSVVDVLSRAGMFVEAENILNSMDVQSATAWRAYIGGCRSYNEIERAERAAEIIMKLDPSDASPYVLLSNMYTKAGRMEEREKIRKLMANNKVKKIPGRTFVEVGGKRYSFVSEDDSHEDMQTIYEELNKLNREMIEAGYKPDISVVTRDLETEEEKLTSLCLHSEKIALAFALRNSPPRTKIRITKNLRVCNDCHNATMFISKIRQREIIVRDSNRFHHFKDGKCSCGQYW